MKKNKALIISITCVVVAIAGIIVTMLATGMFGRMFGKDGENTTAATSKPAEVTEVAVNSRPKSVKPASIVAAEYSEYSDISAADIASFTAKGFNTVTFILTPENGEAVKPLLKTAEENKLYFGIKADASDNTSYISDFIKENNVNYVIFAGVNEADEAALAAASELSTEIKKTDSLTEIGFEPVYGANSALSLPALNAKGVINFIYLSQKGNDEASAKDFTDAVLAWNEKSCPLWLNHNLSELSSINAEKANEIIDCIARSADMAMCKGLSFYPYNDIASAVGPSATSVLNFIQTRETFLLDKEFEITNYSKTEITVEQSKISFIGTSSPAYDLLCNGKKVETAEKSGDFSVECELKPGENTIKFEHKGKTYTYKVTYSIKLLKSVTPSNDVTVPGGMDVGVSVVALKGATVKVKFNGKTYTMKQSEGAADDDENSPDAESDFVYYTASLPTPASTSSVQNLGKFTVSATYNSLSESMTGAKISVSAKEIIPEPEPEPEPEPPETTTGSEGESSSAVTGETNSSESTSGTTNDAGTTVIISGSSDTLEKYSYTKNYGLGTAQVCIITDDYVETYPGNDTNTYSVPDCSPLLRGTVDYINATVSLDKNETYYVLASGVKVPLLREERLASGADGKITHLEVKNGYKMPKNTINLVSATTSNDKTVIVLDMNRPVAFNAKLVGQTYNYYAPDRNVAVSSLNCTGLQLTFSDTSNASGDFSFINSVLKNCKWSSSGSKATLTLNLVQKGKFYGFHYEYNNNGQLVITVNHRTPSLKGAVIMLDPGHGGIDGGAPCVVKATGFENEKNINLSIATKIKEILEAEGATVIMTRSSDKWVCYTDRNNFVRDRNPDVYISIHCDSSSSSASATGTSAYYYRAYSQPLAKAVHNRLVEAYKDKIYADSPDIKVDRGTNFYAFRVTRVEECPAILIEYGFVSNTGECEALQKAENRDILAQATVDGIKDYLSAS